MKKVSNKQFHVSDSPVGKEQNYGSGVKNKMGKYLYNSMDGNTTNKKIGKPPKSLA